MTVEPASVRARKVYAANKYFVLATQDADGPWAAALAFTFVAPNQLCFSSQRSSRHGAALLDGGPVAGVIYNSQCTFEEVESIQFSGVGELAQDPDTIRSVLAAGRGAQDAPPSDEEVEAELSRADAAMFKVTVQRAWVLDQNLFQEKGVDAREPVDISELFAAG